MECLAGSPGSRSTSDVASTLKRSPEVKPVDCLPRTEKNSRNLLFRPPSAHPWRLLLLCLASCNGVLSSQYLESGTSNAEQSGTASLSPAQPDASC